VTLRSGGSGPRRELERRFGGELIWPGRPDYEAARLVENAAFDRRPALVARARGADDVAAVIRFGRASGLPLAVRSGGHSIAGHSTGDGVVVLDVSALNRLEIDPAARTAWCGPGLQAGSYTATADTFGLATPFGDHGTVAVGGITLGGGIGWLVRRDGLTIDSLLAVELVTADGESLVASAADQPDLFWALRGGGGNFGVVTRLKLALHPIDTVLHGSILLPSSPATIRRLLEIAHAAPDELTLMPGVMAIPPMDEVPSEHHGRLGLFIDLLWAGPTAAGLAAISGLRSLGAILLDTVTEKRYPDLFPPPSGNRSAWTSRSLFIDRFDDETIEVIERQISSAPPGDALAIFRVLGGAASRVPNDATAYSWRDKSILLWIISDTGTDDATRMPEMTAWATSFQEELRAFGSATYVNFMADEGSAAVASAYAPTTWARLREVKRRYDPDNVFQLNQNIPPAPPAAV
jgi:FAD/FMN-containing dehydrogenase